MDVPSEGISEELRNLLQTGASGVVVNKAMHMPTNPFSGQGHSLMDSSESTHPLFVPLKNSVKAFDEEMQKDDNRILDVPVAASPDTSSDILSATTDSVSVTKMEVETSEPKQEQPVYKRIGPGSTVVSQPVSNTAESDKMQSETSDMYPKMHVNTEVC